MIALLVIACAAASVAGFSDIRQQLEQTVTTFSSAKWNQEGPALAADIVNAVFVIKKDRVAVNKFEEQLLDLATPSSANYGKWLSKKEVISQLAPPQGSLNTVLDFIASFNVLEDNIRVSDFQDKVFVKVTLYFSQPNVVTLKNVTDLPSTFSFQFQLLPICFRLSLHVSDH